MSRETPYSLSKREQIKIEMGHIEIKINELNSKVLKNEEKKTAAEIIMNKTTTQENNNVYFKLVKEGMNLLIEIGKLMDELIELKQKLDALPPGRPDNHKRDDSNDSARNDGSAKSERPNETKTSLLNTPEGRKFISKLTKPDPPAEEILLKSPRTWTRDEMIQVKKRQYGLPSNDPRGKDMDRRVSQWFSHVYTDKPVKHDATGRMIEPKPVNPPPKKPLPLRDTDGLDLKAGLRRIGARTLAASRNSGLSGAVKSLQGGLNKLERWRQAESNSNRETSNPPLKEDGVLGPKTKTALKRTLVTRGTAQTENAQALGGFHNYVEAGRKGGFKDLAKTVDKSFGPLLRDQAKPKAAKEPHHESLALQNTVNHYGEKQFGRDKWAPLKDDGWIGPKTTDAFAKVAKAVNPERLTRRFGRYLGFI